MLLCCCSQHLSDLINLFIIKSAIMTMTIMTTLIIITTIIILHQQPQHSVIEQLLLLPIQQQLLLLSHFLYITRLINIQYLSNRFLHMVVAVLILRFVIQRVGKLRCL